MDPYCTFIGSVQEQKAKNLKGRLGSYAQAAASDTYKKWKGRILTSVQTYFTGSLSAKIDEEFQFLV